MDLLTPCGAGRPPPPPQSDRQAGVLPSPSAGEPSQMPTEPQSQMWWAALQTPQHPAPCEAELPCGHLWQGEGSWTRRPRHPAPRCSQACTPRLMAMGGRAGAPSLAPPTPSLGLSPALAPSVGDTVPRGEPTLAASLPDQSRLNKRNVWSLRRKGQASQSSWRRRLDCCALLPTLAPRGGRSHPDPRTPASPKAKKHAGRAGDARGPWRGICGHRPRAGEGVAATARPAVPRCPQA